MCVFLRISSSSATNIHTDTHIEQWISSESTEQAWTKKANKKPANRFQLRVKKTLMEVSGLKNGANAGATYIDIYIIITCN